MWERIILKLSDKTNYFPLKKQGGQNKHSLKRKEKTWKSKICKIWQSAKESWVDSKTRWKYYLKHSYGQGEPVSR